MIHDTVPVDEAEKVVSVESIVYRLRQFVRHRLQGKENAMKSGALMSMLGFPSGGTNRKLRRAAKLLLREEKIPLISDSSGFYVAQTIEELSAYLQNLEARRQGLEESENGVREILEKWLKRPKGDLFEW